MGLVAADRPPTTCLGTAVLARNRLRASRELTYRVRRIHAAEAA